jgi:hypothetical protein
VSNQNHEIRYTLARFETSQPRRSANSAIGSHSQPLGLPLPRITRLMALAIKLEDMRRDPDALSYGEMAQLGHVSRARAHHQARSPRTADAPGRPWPSPRL